MFGKSQGSEAKLIPAAKAERGALFNFQHAKKSSGYLSAYTFVFFTHRTSNMSPTATLSLGVGCASLA